jgi:hypothetical protein
MRKSLIGLHCTISRRPTVAFTSVLHKDLVMKLDGGCEVIQNDDDHHTNRVTNPTLVANLVVLGLRRLVSRAPWRPKAAKPSRRADEARVFPRPLDAVSACDAPSQPAT